MLWKLPLVAGKTLRTYAPGRTFVVLSLGDAPQLRCTFFGGGPHTEDFDECGKGFAFRLPNGAFEGFELTSTVAAVVKVYTSQQLIEIPAGLEGSRVRAFIENTPLPVAFSGVQNVAIASSSVLPVNVNSLPFPRNATSVANSPTVAVSAAGAVLVGANSFRAVLRIANLGAAPMAIVRPGGAWAQRCVVLAPGALHHETMAPQLAWSAVTDTGASTVAGIQEMQ